MSKTLAAVAALIISGAAALPLQANAAEHRPGISKEATQPTDISARRRHYRQRYHVRRYYVGPPRYFGPRYGYDYPYPYFYQPHYYQPAPFVPFGFGAYGVRVF
jgi:hypothetical protein